MIILKSDYSPEVAPDKQEQDNMRMLQMLLVFSGLSQKEIIEYNKYTDAAARAYGNSLAFNTSFEPDWEKAKEATKAPLDVASQILVQAGITIENKLTISNEPGYFSHITTTVYNDFANMEEIARIERPVTDIEAETYEENSTGYGATTGIEEDHE